MRKKLALCIGINDYPGVAGDLRGCVNDANDWAALLRAEGYEIVAMIFDSQATKATMLGAMQSVVGRAGFGDRVVITYSGHGSWVPDRDGDEADRRDETLVPYDYAAGNMITDDELHAVFSTRKHGVRLTMMSDSCYSGTVTRFLSQGSAEGTPRFVSPADVGVMTESRAAELEQKVVKTSSRASAILLSGSSDLEVSYDAPIDGRYRGAMTAAALSAYRPGMSWAAWHRAIRKILPSANYPQSPQLSATKSQRYGRAL